MSDDWNKPPQGPPNASPSQDAMPRPGESWSDRDEPKPIHAPDNDWGTAPAQPSGPPNAQPHGVPPAQHMPSTYSPQNQLAPQNDLTNDDIIAIVVSLFLPGVGQIMLGQTTKGIVLLVSFFLLSFCFIGLVIWPIALVDTYMLIKARKTRPVDDWEFFPK